jgi:ABC-type bacteriocin/lantibiotic exporter with double-glycine peptidase domain
VKIIKKILDLLDPSERRHAGTVMCMILIMAFLDVLGVASILPFLTVLTRPELVQTNAILKTLYELVSSVGVETTNEFLFILGLMVFTLLILSLAVKALTSYVQIRFVLLREYSIGRRLIEGYLSQPYSWFLNRNSTDLGKSVLSEVQAVIANGMLPLMTLISQTAVACAFLLLLLVVNPELAFSVILVLGLAYTVTFIGFRGALKRFGTLRTQANQQRFNAVSEAFAAIREVKVAGLEQQYVHRFSLPAKAYASGQAGAQIVAQLPRFAMEAIAFGGLMLVLLYLLHSEGDFESSIPLIAMYAFAGYRLMPALQQIYASSAQIRFVGPALDNLHEDFFGLNDRKPAVANLSSLVLRTSIELTNVTYTYPEATAPSINAVNLSIPAFSRVGFVGATGSGKTTLVDLILGLLVPQDGELKVDGQTVTAADIRKWQSAIGYVPQHIFLIDDSIAANIAFGVAPEERDQAAIKLASEIASLHEFVSEELPEGYDTIVGERGVRLSGGQRQRIGIARALYHNPKVLILDEATSALDNLIEQQVIDAIKFIYLSAVR